MTDSKLPTELLDSLRTQTGEMLSGLSRQSPVLVIFLRHCGCTFAREALDDIARHRLEIALAGVAIVLVHMQTDDAARELFARYKLDDLPRISDPDQKLYQAFELQRGSVWQVMGPANFLAGIRSLLKGNLAAVPSADIFQLPGAFLIQDGRILNAFRGHTSSERPDYVALAQCPRSN